MTTQRRVALNIWAGLAQGLHTPGDEADWENAVVPGWAVPLKEKAAVNPSARYRFCKPCGVEWRGDDDCWAPDHQPEEGA